MVSRKTQCGWMALGGALCLFGIVLACKLKDGNRARAETRRPARTSVAAAAGPLAAAIASGQLVVQAEPPAAGAALPPISSVFFDGPKPAPTTKEPPAVADKNDGPVLEPPLLPLVKEPQPLPPAVDTRPSLLTPPPPVIQARFEVPGKEKAASEVPAPPLPVQKPAPPPALDVAPPPPPAVEKKPADAALPPAPMPPPAARANVALEPGEPPLSPAGPAQIYRVRHDRETIHEIARRTLGSGDRWVEVARLNPSIKPELGLALGTLVKLPSDACLVPEELEAVKPLPQVRAKTEPAKARPMPLTGTYVGALDEQKRLTLPRGLREQLGDAQVLVSPGSDVCLWLTTPGHLERLHERLEQARVREADVRVFRRLYFAQAEKVAVNGEGRLVIPERLAQFAGLHQEVVLVGIDDHVELWDAARWRRYTQEKSARPEGE